MKPWMKGAAGIFSQHERPSLEDSDASTSLLAASSVPAVPRWNALANLVDSERFQAVIGSVIITNAIVLGLETYASINAQYGQILSALNNIFYFVFLCELILRILSYGSRPWNFFRNGWNVFDFIVIGGVLLPVFRENLTILRLLRLARIARLMRFLPDARVLMLTVTRATPAVASMAVLTVLILFVYGIIGWTLFGQKLPNEWGDIGTAMLTLFILLTLENFPTYLQAAQEVSPLATIYFLSYILIAAFIIVNLLIGIVISSMERAREQEAAEAHKRGQDHLGALLDHLNQAREQINELEGEIQIMRDEGYFPSAHGVEESHRKQRSPGQ